MAIDLEACETEVRERGFCILQDQLPRDLLQECNEVFTPTLLEFAKEHADNPTLPATHR